MWSFRKIPVRLKEIARAEDGVALTEFALTLPIFLLVFSVVIGGARMMWTYQMMIGGVRDATRYLARVAPADICAGGGSVAGYKDTLTAIISGAGSSAFLPLNVTLDDVTPGYRCVAGTYRHGTVAVAQVSADITITFPFAPMATLVGASPATLSTTVTDQSRIYGS